MDEISLTKRERSLPKRQHDDFFKAVIGGSTDKALAVQFGLEERTATNYRIRAQQLASQRGITIPGRNKGPAASDDQPHDLQPKG
ncbi:MAG: hypothetical protein ACO1SV_27540 [Fimbriimonas sp.]